MKIVICDMCGKQLDIKPQAVIEYGVLEMSKLCYPAFEKHFCDRCYNEIKNLIEEKCLKTEGLVGVVL